MTTPAENADARDAIDKLPFVGPRVSTPEEQACFPQNFWLVQPSGDYLADCRMGHEFGRACIRAIRDDQFPSLLGWVVSDMIRSADLSSGHDGLIIGFMAEVGRSLLRGAPNSGGQRA